MATGKKWLARLAAVAVLVVVVVITVQKRRSGPGTDLASDDWPPLDPEAGRRPGTDLETAPSTDLEPAPSTDLDRPAGHDLETSRAPWVPPVAGACPASHPVKAKTSSKIFHVPGGANYERTKPDRCYLDPDSAEADGFRRSKV